MRLKRLICGLVALLAFSTLAPAQTIRGENFSGGTTVTVADEYIGCNFSFQQPKIMANGTTIPQLINLPTTATFFRCNFVNSRPQEGSQAVKCNTTLMARQIETGTELLSVVTDDGTTVSKTIKAYSTIIYGRGVYTGQQYTVNYLPSPKMIPSEAPEGSRSARIREKYDAYLEAHAARGNASSGLGEIE